MANLYDALQEEVDSRIAKILWEECKVQKNGEYSKYDKELAREAAKAEFKDDLAPAFKSMDKEALVLLEKLIDGNFKDIRI